MSFIQCEILVIMLKATEQFSVWQQKSVEYARQRVWKISEKVVPTRLFKCNIQPSQHCYLKVNEFSGKEMRIPKCILFGFYDEERNCGQTHSENNNKEWAFYRQELAEPLTYIIRNTTIWW